VIQKTIAEKVLPKLGDGKILNTNIPEHILLDAGVKEGQYVKPDGAVAGIGAAQREPDVTKSRGR